MNKTNCNVDKIITRLYGAILHIYQKDIYDS